MKILILDNYDSFTFNLLHYVESFDVDCTVVRNDEIDLNDVDRFDKVIISPGPGLPSTSGRMMELIDQCSGHKPMLGICLGLQGIVEHFGGVLYQMEQVAHGVPLECTVVDPNEDLFNDVPENFEAGMYHSWAAERKGLPEELIITAEGKNGVIMGIRHRSQDIRALQFHPESIMTPEGKKMIGNWMRI